MESIIDELYYGGVDILERKPSPEYQEQFKKLSPFLQEIEEHFGTKRSTDFIYALSDVQTAQEKDAFREGCRFGVRLMIELLTDNNTASL